MKSVQGKKSSFRIIKKAATIALFSAGLATFAGVGVQNGAGLFSSPAVTASADTTTTAQPTTNQLFSVNTRYGSQTTLNTNSFAQLTQSQYNDYGYATTNKKLDLTKDFSLTGRLYLGSRVDGGGDAFNILFSPDNPNTLRPASSTGGMLGMNGLASSFGLVFDEHYNSDSSYGDFQNKSWWQGGRYEGVVSWRTTSPDGTLNSNKRQDTGIGFASAQSADEKAQVVSMNKDMINGQGHPFAINYNAATSTITISVPDNSYSGAFGRDAQLVYTKTGAISGSTWTKQVTSQQKKDGLYLSFAGVTGAKDYNNFAVAIDSTNNINN